MVVLSEGTAVQEDSEDPFLLTMNEQIRVLRLTPSEKAGDDQKRTHSCVVEIWQHVQKGTGQEQKEWKLALPTRR